MRSSLTPAVVCNTARQSVAPESLFAKLAGMNSPNAFASIFPSSVAKVPRSAETPSFSNAGLPNIVPASSGAATPFSVKLSTPFTSASTSDLPIAAVAPSNK